MHFILSVSRLYLPTRSTFRMSHRISGIFVFSALLCLLLCGFLVLARPIDDKLRQDMTEALEEDYDNLAALWNLVNEYYQENNDNYNTLDSVECLN